MIISIAKANFSSNNIGTLSSFNILYNLGAGASTSGVNRVNKNEKYEAVITITENYVLNGSVVITMGGKVLDGVVSESGNSIRITISSVTGNVVVKVPTKSTIQVPDEPEVDGTPTQYTITYKYMCGGVSIKADTTEKVNAGIVKSFNKSNAPAVTGYIAQSVSPASATVNSNIIVTYTYTSADISGENTKLSLTQGYATNTELNNVLATRVKTDFIEGNFSVEVNDGYVIRAVYEYEKPSIKDGNGVMVVTSSQNLTKYEKTSTSKYYIITFCKTNANSNILPTESIVKNFTGKIYEGGYVEESPEVTGDYIEVDGIKIKMGQLLDTSLNESHAGRAYTVNPINSKVTISTSGSNFTMIPLLDVNNKLEDGIITLWTGADGAINNNKEGSIQYHDTLNIADIKALNSNANVHVMFKHKTATSFKLSDLQSAIKIN